MDPSSSVAEMQNLMQRWFEAPNKLDKDTLAELEKDTQRWTISILTSNFDDEAIEKITSTVVKVIYDNLNSAKPFAEWMHKNTTYKRGMEAKGTYVPLHKFLASIINLAHINIENTNPNSPNYNNKHDVLKKLTEFDTNLLYSASTGKISYKDKDLNELLDLWKVSPKDREAIAGELVQRLNDDDTDIDFEDLGIKKDENFLTNIFTLLGTQCSKIEYIEFPEKMKSVDLGLLKYFKGLKGIMIHDCKEIKNFHVLNVCKKLDIIDVTGSNISDEDLLEITECKSLGGLTLSNCRNIKNSEFLKNFPLLRVLEVDDCKDMKEIDNLKLCPNLEVLNISNCQKIKTFSSISYCGNINSLFLAGTGIINKGFVNELTFLKHLNNLENLDVSNCKQIENLTFLQFCPNLIDLYLSHCEIKEIKDVGYCANLERLYLTNCKNINDIENVGMCQNLKYLNIVNCNFTRIDGYDPEQHDYLEYSQFLIDSGFLANLESINISACKKLTNIQVLLDLPNLQKITAIDCSTNREVQNTLRALKGDGLKVITSKPRRKSNIPKGG